MASWRPLPGVVRSRRALTVSLIQSSCRRYQPRGVVGALSWRVARRRSGSRMVAGVRGGCPGSGGGWAGWAAGVLGVYVDIWLALVGLGRAGRCRVASWVKDRPRGAVVVSWRPADGDGGRVRARARSGLVDVWVMHGMVMDETLHVFPGSGVGELLRVC